MKTIKHYFWPLFCCWFVFVPLIAIMVYPSYYGAFCNLIIGMATFFVFSLWFQKRSINRRDRIIHHLILFSPMAAFTLFYLWMGPDSYGSSLNMVFAPVLGSLSGMLFIWFKELKLRIIVSIVTLAVTLWICLDGLEKWFYYWNVLHNYHVTNIETGNVFEDTPLFSFTNDSVMLNNSKLLGKTVVVDFWGQTCGPCFIAIPKFLELKQKYSSNKNIVFLLVNIPYKRETLNQADSTLKNHGFNIQTYIGPKSTEAFENLKIASYPVTWIINKEGKLIYRGTINNVERILRKEVF